MSDAVKTFRRRAGAAIADARLQKSLASATGRFRQHRQEALAELPGADPMRTHFKQLRAATIANLAEHLHTFETNATAAGAQVHWALDGAEAARIVTEIAQKHGVNLAVKSKSMVTEEIHLNRALAEHGIQAVETDLGEWIVQLAGETPSHIIAPAIHKTREQVAELLSQEAGRQLPTDIPALTEQARRRLREKFLQAGMGISGGNIAVADSGSVVLVTNEGNGRMVTSLPKVHVAVIGIEKVAPTWDEATVWLSLLARSATGQPLSIYTSVITGPARAGDEDGPEEVHIILLDNRRSAQLGTQYEEVLQCIRCGACVNVCPVYQHAGGHSYGSPYSGPIGAVVSPLLFGLAEHGALPQASSLCGACLEVCPAQIDLPRMLLALRQDEVQRRQLPAIERLAERSAANIMAKPGWYKLFAGLARRLQALFVRKGRMRLPGVAPYPALAPRSFHQLWHELEDEA